MKRQTVKKKGHTHKKERTKKQQKQRTIQATWQLS